MPPLFQMEVEIVTLSVTERIKHTNLAKFSHSAWNVIGTQDVFTLQLQEPPRHCLSYDSSLITYYLPRPHPQAA